MSDIGKQVSEMREAGVPTIEIAHRLGVAQSTVHYHLRRLVAPTLERQSTAPALPTEGGRRSVRTRELVAELLKQGIPRAEIARQLGIAKSTVSYHARRLGQPIDQRSRRRYDWRLIQSHYDAGNSARDCARAFGFCMASWHDAVRRGLIQPRPAFKPLDEIFAANTRRNRGHLKLRILRAGLKDNRCERCGLSEWIGQPITITLHHVNGDRLDNRLENLQFLCGNCHSQTETFAGRNGQRVRLGLSSP